MPNAEQVEFWNGIAGDRWVAGQEGMDRTIRPLGDAALEALHPSSGESVLDVGCGCGQTSLQLAERVGASGKVFGVDVSKPMLARAKERAVASGLPIDLRLADAASADLPKVDAIYSRFGVMFFDDPVAAFTHLRGALRPGGRLAFVCWQAPSENPWARIPNEAVSTVLGPPEKPAPGAPGPFAFADPTYVNAILQSAGFTGIQMTPVSLDLPWTDGNDQGELRERFVQIGPAARRLAVVEPELRERAIVAMLEAMKPHMRGTRVWFKASVWVVQAANPST